MTLLYVPLEGYRERYTAQWSAPKTGWLERNWVRAGVDYKRIEGASIADENRLNRKIGLGSVVDAVGRPHFCFQQMERLLQLADGGYLKDDDVIFLDDFWTPGLEALPYAFHLLGIKPKVYAFLHAQSVDEFDFTHPMREWMRHIEKGYAEFMSGIFVCCPSLKDAVCYGGISDRSKVHVTGHPFNSEEVMERMPKYYNAMIGTDPERETRVEYMDEFDKPRKNQVVWSSRFDREKDPMFFLDVVRYVKTKTDQQDTKFIVCTSAPKLRSNYPEAHARLLGYAGQGWLDIRENLTKEEYYAILCESKVQFNCALQDWVAITLLEASVAGCYPIYPYFRSFPETFLMEKGYQYMYPFRDVVAAGTAICWTVDHDSLWTAEAIKERSWIHRRFDSSWLRMLSIMDVASPLTHGNELVEIEKDPFNPLEW